MSGDNSNNNGDYPQEFLTFSLGEEIYGVDVLKVREIRGWEKIRELHDTPKFVKGVLDLRGSIVPIVDLRIRFNIADYEYTSTTVIIIISLESGGLMGAVVDSVSDVLGIKSDQIKESPSLGTKINTNYILGMATIDTNMVMLVDADKLLNAEEFEVLSHIEGVA